MNQKIYENYAKLAVKIGINLQKGQDVTIVASTRLVDIVKEVTKVCFLKAFNKKLNKKHLCFIVNLFLKNRLTILFRCDNIF